MIMLHTSSQDLNTIKKVGVLQKDDNTTRMDYQVTAENSTENSSVQVLHITRKLDTGDPQDVPITVSYLSIQTGVGGGFFIPQKVCSFCLS